MPKTKIREITHQLILRYAAALRESEKSAATIRKYVRDLTVLCDYLEGSILTKTALIGWKEQLTSRYAPSSVNTMLAAMNGLLEFCGLGELNVKPLKIQKSMFTRGDKELTRGEYIRLVSAAESHGSERLSLVIQTICATGIRVSELQFITALAVGSGRAEITGTATRAEVSAVLHRYVESVYSVDGN